jgi:hypothetical protein
MHGKSILMIAVFAAVAALSGASPGTVLAAGLAEPKVEYSADQYIGSGDRVMKSRVYHAPGKQRMDMGDSDQAQYLITRMDRKVSWVVMPEQKMYMEMSLEEGRKKNQDITNCSFSRKAVGNETVNGIPATKSEIDVSCPDKSEYSGTMWTSKEGIMVKMDAVAKGKGSKSRIQLELKNLKIGRQDPGLFEVPSGYRPMKFPMGIAPGGRPAAVEQEKEPQEPSRPGEPPKEKGTVEKAVEPMKKIKGIFGW